MVKPYRMSEAEHARRVHPGKPLGPQLARSAWAGASPTEREFAEQLGDVGLGFEREHRFAKARKWRFDFALPELKIAVEIDGGVHRIAERFASDREKLNAATLQGWRVLRFSPTDVARGVAIALTRELVLAVSAGWHR